MEISLEMGRDFSRGKKQMQTNSNERQIFRLKSSPDQSEYRISSAGTGEGRSRFFKAR